MPRSTYFNDRVDVEWMKPTHVKTGQVLTIEQFEEIHSSLGRRPCVRFKELPGVALTLNATNYDFFSSQFGEEEFQWGGEKVVVSIEPVENPRNGQRLQPGIRFKKYNPNAATMQTKTPAKGKK